MSRTGRSRSYSLVYGYHVGGTQQMRGASTRRDLGFPSAILCASLMMPCSIRGIVTPDGLWTPPRRSKEALTLVTNHCPA